MPSSIKIYGLQLQHNYCAIHATCKLAKIEEEFVTCNIMEGDQHKPEYVAKFPMHCCPAMEDTENGLCVTESNAILRYIARKTGSKLYPDDLKQAAICDMVLDHKLCSLGKDIASTFIYPAAGFAEAVTPEKEFEVLEKLKKDQWPAVQKFINESKGPFVCGAQVTIADLSLWGHVKLVAILFGKDCKMFEACEGMKAWFDAVEGQIGDDWFSEETWGFWNSKKKA